MCFKHHVLWFLLKSRDTCIKTCRICCCSCALKLPDVYLWSTWRAMTPAVTLIESAAHRRVFADLQMSIHIPECRASLTPTDGENQKWKHADVSTFHSQQFNMRLRQTDRQTDMPTVSLTSINVMWCLLYQYPRLIKCYNVLLYVPVVWLRFTDVVHRSSSLFTVKKHLQQTSVTCWLLDINEVIHRLFFFVFLSFSHLLSLPRYIYLMQWWSF